MFTNSSPEHSGRLEEGVLGRCGDQRLRRHRLHDIRQRKDPAVGRDGGGASGDGEKQEQVRDAVKREQTRSRMQTVATGESQLLQSGWFYLFCKNDVSVIKYAICAHGEPQIG